MVRTVEVKSNIPKDVLVTSLAGTEVIITSSGLLKVMQERNGKLVNVIFLKERERYHLFVCIGDKLILHNQSYQKSLSVYLIDW